MAAMWIYETDDPNKHRLMTDDKTETRQVRDALPRFSAARFLTNVALWTEKGSLFELDTRYLLALADSIHPVPDRLNEYLGKAGLVEVNVIALPVIEPLVDHPALPKAEIA